MNIFKSNICFKSDGESYSKNGYIKNEQYFPNLNFYKPHRYLWFPKYNIACKMEMTSKLKEAV